MKTKEAIKIIKKDNKIRMFCNAMDSRDKGKYDEIFSLLKRGEKYEEIWRELFKDIEEREQKCEVACDIVYVSWLKILEQKYFPKKVIK